MGYPQTEDLFTNRPVVTLAEVLAKAKLILRANNIDDHTEDNPYGTEFGVDLVAVLADLVAALADVATSGDYVDLINPPTLGSAAGNDTEDFAAAADTAIECIWTGSAWTTLSGGSVPTGSALIRSYSSVTDPAADEPTAYNAHDRWYGATA